MATKQTSVQVVEMNPGPKIKWRQSGYKLIFGDDDLTFRCDNRQRDYPVHEDICVDDNGNLMIGVGKYYVAQVDIPARKYVETEPEPEATEPAADSPEEYGPAENAVQREAIPLDMTDVVLSLFSTAGTGITI